MECNDSEIAPEGASEPSGESLIQQCSELCELSLSAVNHSSQEARSIQLGERFDKSAAQKHADQVALVVGAAFEIVNRIGGLG